LVVPEPPCYAARGKQLFEKNGLKILRIYADVELTPKRLEAAVAMAVKINRSAMRCVPRSEREMAEDEQSALKRKLGVGLHSTPSEFTNSLAVVVASDQVLLSVQLSKDLGREARESKISKMPNFIAWTHSRIPSLYQFFIHRSYGGERAPPNVEDAVIPKVGVAGEKYVGLHFC